MRQLMVEVPRGQGEQVLRIAERHEGANLVRLPGEGAEGPLDLVIAHLKNAKVEPFLQEVQDVEDLRLVMLPQGAITLRPPPEKAAELSIDVEPRSPFEVFFAGLQSIGSWKGFLSYAAAAGVVVWIGLFTERSYLLVAAMLLAPFAGPAMNVAMGTARGDWRLIRQGLGRYVASLAVTIAVNLVLTLVLGQDVATSMMVDASQISSVAVLLPLAAGAAGALNLCKSDRDSLVSGAAVGMLVAASLAPPAGIIGMAIGLGEWGMVKAGAFLLALQLVGINLSGALVFRLFGLDAKGTRYERGRGWLFPVGLAASVLAVVLLVVWQLQDRPELQRSSRAQRASAVARRAIDDSGLANPVEVDLRFTRARIPGQDTLLGVVYVQRLPDLALSDAEIEARLTEALQERILAEDFDVTPLVDVNVLRSPRSL